MDTVRFAFTTRTARRSRGFAASGTRPPADVIRRGPRTAISMRPPYPARSRRQGGNSIRDGRNRAAQVRPAPMLDPDSTGIGAPLERLPTAAAHGPGTAPTRAQAAGRWTEMNDANARPSEIQQRQDRPALGV